MIHYLDISLAVQAVPPTDERDHVIAWLASSELVSSRLSRTEITRTLRREGRPIDDGDWLVGRTVLVDINRATHARAEAIEANIKTLDALHLATAIDLDFTVTIATRDVRMAEIAQALGLGTTDAR